MRAVITTPNGASLVEKAVPEVSAQNNARVKIRSVAICRTDLYAAEGLIKVPEGQIIGHEFSGVVDEVHNSVSGLCIGDRVVANPSISCGRCNECLTGDTHRCAEATFLGIGQDGAFADYIVVPELALHRLDAKLTFGIATFAEPVAAGIAVLDTDINHSHEILVLGEGRITSLTLEIFRHAGYRNIKQYPTLIDRGIQSQFNVIVETCGIEREFSEVINALQPGGTLIIKSRQPTDPKLPLLQAINKQIVMRAVKYGPFGEALDFVTTNSEWLDSFLDDNWSLEDYYEAFQLAKTSEDKKICFRVSE